MEEIIGRFNSVRVRYLLIGGQAVRLEGMPRFSMDWDFYIPPDDKDNIALVNSVLEDDLDMPLVPLGPRGENFIQTFQISQGILQFHLGGAGLPPFEEAERLRVKRVLEGGTPVWCLSGEHLLQSKEAANRPQDQSDLLFLRAKYRG